MRRVFGRNNPEVDPKTAYRMESDRVLQAVQNPEYLDELGDYESWYPYVSIFQATAFEGQYGDIVADLARIESRVVFND